MNKNTFQKVGALYIIRFAILLFSSVNQSIYGLLSRLRTGAIFPQYINNDCYVSFSAEIKYPDRIQMGHGVRIGPNCVIGAMGGVDIGDNVRFSKGVVVETGGLDVSKEPPYSHIANSIKIESGVWIGSNAIILAGVKIGRNAVVGAGAIVTKDVPENMIFAGNPAKTIKARGK